MSVRQGPHQGAQKSTRTGLELEASTTSVMKFSVVATIFCAVSGIGFIQIR